MTHSTHFIYDYMATVLNCNICQYHKKKSLKKLIKYHTKGGARFSSVIRVFAQDAMGH